LVHLAEDFESGSKCRIKCFWEPDSNRRRRSELLVKRQLADLGKTQADALGGAPYEVLGALGPHTPFAIIMKNVNGTSWKNLKDAAPFDGRYPPSNWPPLKVRATWAYGLATAVLNMEKLGFIHADLSDGNVMVTPSGQYAGDMALVDFDSFIHPANPDRDSTCKGSDGYAAPEIWNGTSVKIGSDRIGLAILIQEFLVMGDPSLSTEEAFGWKYNQNEEICNLKGEAHPYFARKYPPLAKLVLRTLRASSPGSRPSPDLWRPMLNALALGRSLRRKLLAVTINAHPFPRTDVRIAFADNQKSLDLSKTAYGIHATLERNSDASVDAVVHSGSKIHVKDHSSRSWKSLDSGDHIALTPGVVLFDPQGKMNARVDGQEH
jgi:serine/threonine protein kinase